MPMMPVVAGARTTNLQMLVYSVLLFPLALAPWFLGMAGAVYGAMAVLLGGLFVLASIRVWHDNSDQSARKMFAYSIFYLFALFTLLIADRAPGLLPAAWN